MSDSKRFELESSDDLLLTLFVVNPSNLLALILTAGHCFLGFMSANKGS